MQTSPPLVLRIKRKRGEDPLQALILEGRQPTKKSKPATPVASTVPSPSNESRSWYFQLDTTEAASQSPADLENLLTESKATNADARHFVIPKKHDLEDDIIPNELSDMVANYLTFSEPTTRKKRKATRKEASTGSSTNAGDYVDESGDYVLDTYKLSSIEPLTEANYPKSLIGYIRFFDDDEYDLMQSDDEVVSNNSDDEDSNAESFYQNDYPEDEDAGAYSDSYAVPESEDNSGSELDLDEIDPRASDEFLAEGQSLRGTDEFDNLYDDLMNREGEAFIESQSYERQSFFSDEADDELAIHRDRIFSRLQKMIDES